MADSAFVTAVVPFLVGAWIHDPTDVSTEQHFPYTDGGAEGLGVTEALTMFVGRKYPVLESGTQEDWRVQTKITIPAGPTMLSQVAWWEARKRAGATLSYRDGRGRVVPAVISGDLSVEPSPSGTIIGVTMQVVDYPLNSTLPASDYNPASPSDGGYGTGGYGVTGYGL